MTAPLVAPEYSTSDAPTDDPAEQQVITALAVYFASPAAISATVLPAHLVTALMALGISRRAAYTAGRFALRPTMAGRTRHGMPLNLPTGSAAGQVRAEEALMRARYLVNAARRLHQALVDGGLGTATRRELGWLGAHTRAGRRRREKAREVDRQADANGKLRWVAVLDERTTPDCRFLDGSVFTPAQMPRVNGMIAIPGAVHPRCRCSARPAATTPFEAFR